MGRIIDTLLLRVLRARLNRRLAFIDEVFEVMKDYTDEALAEARQINTRAEFWESVRERERNSFEQFPGDNTGD